MKDEDRHKISLIHISLLYKFVEGSTCETNGMQAMTMNDCIRREMYGERTCQRKSGGYSYPKENQDEKEAKHQTEIKSCSWVA